MAFLGAPGVGKTQILQVSKANFMSSFRSLKFTINFPQQFFKHDFSETHVRTAKPFRYRSCLVCDTMIRELIVLDVPPQVSYFFLETLNWRQSFAAGFPLPLRSKFMHFLFFLFRSRKFKNRKSSPSTISPNGITTKIHWVYGACKSTFSFSTWETWKRFK